MANVGTGLPGKTLIGAGNGASPTYASIGTNSGLTQFGLVVAQNNGAFQALAAGTLGIPLIGKGAANPAYGTAIVAGGGTGQVTLTNHGVLVGAATSAITQLAAGTAGQVLQSGGASADPAYSTATYPVTATGTGTILRADGTNWVATTATYPNTAGTSGNVLTSNGTNFVSQAPPVLVATGQLTSSQIKALHGTPIQAIAAPGAGKAIQIISYWGSFVYGGNNVFVAGASQAINIYYGTTVEILAFVSNAIIVGSTSKIGTTPGGFVIGSTATTSIDNIAVNLYNSVATEITGNAANDNVINWTILYTIVSD